MLKKTIVLSETPRGGYIQNYGLINTDRIIWAKRTTARDIEGPVIMLKMDGDEVLMCVAKLSDFLDGDDAR